MTRKDILKKYGFSWMSNWQRKKKHPIEFLQSSGKRQKDTMNWSVRKDMGMIKSISER